MALTTSQTALCAMLFGATVSGVGTHHVVKKRNPHVPQKSVSTSIIAPSGRTVQTASGGSVTILDAPVFGNCITPDLPEAFEVPELRRSRPELFPTAGGGQIIQIGLSPAVAEPDTWAMMIAGFGFVGLSLRRKSLIKKEIA